MRGQEILYIDLCLHFAYLHIKVRSASMAKCLFMGQSQGLEQGRLSWLVSFLTCNRDWCSLFLSKSESQTIRIVLDLVKVFDRRKQCLCLVAWLRNWQLVEALAGRNLALAHL